MPPEDFAFFKTRLESVLRLLKVPASTLNTLTASHVTEGGPYAPAQPVAEVRLADKLRPVQVILRGAQSAPRDATPLGVMASTFFQSGKTLTVEVRCPKPEVPAPGEEGLQRYSVYVTLTETGCNISFGRFNYSTKWPMAPEDTRTLLGHLLLTALTPEERHVLAALFTAPPSFASPSRKEMQPA